MEHEKWEEKTRWTEKKNHRKLIMYGTKWHSGFFFRSFIQNRPDHRALLKRTAKICAEWKMFQRYEKCRFLWMYWVLRCRCLVFGIWFWIKRTERILFENVAANKPKQKTVNTYTQHTHTNNQPPAHPLFWMLSS